MTMDSEDDYEKIPDKNSKELPLNIFTLNCWGIPIVSANRKERIKAIASYLENSAHNIVCLQEIWSEEDYLYLKGCLKTLLPYSHYFYSGVLGSGLCVFTKFPIQDVFFHQWPLNGYIHKIHHGDWFGGKGVGLCRLKCNNSLVNVYCTHLHAEYHQDDIYLAHRVLQAHSTAEFIKLTTAPADVSILAGDLNTAPGDLSYRLITQLPQLEDPFDLKCEGTNPSIAKPSGTSNNANNSYSDPKEVKNCPEGKRIDHILFHVNNATEVVIQNFGNPLRDRVPDQQFSYSDHNAVTLELRLKYSKRKSTSRQNSTNENLKETIAEATKVCEDAFATIARAKRLYLTVGGLLFMFILGTVGFWAHNALNDMIKITLTAVCLYYLAMGSLWNRIEMNSLKAGLMSLQNFTVSREAESGQVTDWLSDYLTDKHKDQILSNTTDSYRT